MKEIGEMIKEKENEYFNFNNGDREMGDYMNSLPKGNLYYYLQMVKLK